MPGRAVGVDAPSCLHLCPREFAADTDESGSRCVIRGSFSSPVCLIVLMIDIAVNW